MIIFEIRDDEHDDACGGRRRRGADDTYNDDEDAVATISVCLTTNHFNSFENLRRQCDSGRISVYFPCLIGWLDRQLNVGWK